MEPVLKQVASVIFSTLTYMVLESELYATSLSIVFAKFPLIASVSSSK